MINIRFENKVWSEKRRNKDLSNGAISFSAYKLATRARQHLLLKWVRFELEISCWKYLRSSSKVLVYTLLCHCCSCCCCCCCCYLPALWKMWENFVIQFHMQVMHYVCVFLCALVFVYCFYLIISADTRI